MDPHHKNFLHVDPHIKDSVIVDPPNQDFLIVDPYNKDFFIVDPHNKDSKILDPHNTVGVIVWIHNEHSLCTKAEIKVLSNNYESLVHSGPPTPDLSTSTALVQKQRSEYFPRILYG